MQNLPPLKRIHKKANSIQLTEETKIEVGDINLGSGDDTIYPKPIEMQEIASKARKYQPEEAKQVELEEEKKWDSPTIEGVDRWGLKPNEG